MYANQRIIDASIDGRIDDVKNMIEEHKQAWERVLMPAKTWDELHARMCENAPYVIFPQYFEKALEYVCTAGNIELAKLLMEVYHGLSYTFLEKAYLGEHHDMIQYLRKQGYTCEQSSMKGACQSGNIENINTLPDWTVDWGLIGACSAGQLSVAELMISRGATNYNMGMFEASLHGHKEIVELMISYGANQWDPALEKACLGGHLEIAEMMISYGAISFNRGLHEACRGGHMELVELMLRHGAQNWQTGLEGACAGGNVNIAKYMMRYGTINVDSGLYWASRKGQMDTVRIMLSCGARYVHVDLPEIIHAGNMELLANTVQLYEYDDDSDGEYDEYDDGYNYIRNITSDANFKKLLNMCIAFMG